MQVIPVIRYCQEKDYDKVLPLIKETVLKALPGQQFEEDKIEVLFEKALTDEDYTGIVLLIDNEICGYILGYVTEHYFHSKKIAYCMSIYVKEDNRAYGLEMLRSFEAWGKYKKADVLSISTFTNLSPENLGKLYNRLGYTQKEVVYWKDI